jgi:plasmid stabilization system protein ParE
VKRLLVSAVPEAEEAILRQVLYIAQDSVDNALAWENRLRTAVKGLATFHGHAIDENTSKKLGYPIQKLIFEGTYLIFYHVDDTAGEVRVVNFRHGARLPLAEEP